MGQCVTLTQGVTIGDGAATPRIPWSQYSVLDILMFPVNNVVHFCELLLNVQSQGELTPLSLPGMRGKPLSRSGSIATAMRYRRHEDEIIRNLR